MGVLALAVAAIFTACGSDDGKKVVPHYDIGGEGGDGAAGEATSGSGGTSGNGGNAGSGIGGDAGNGTSGGEPNTGDGGSAGVSNGDPLGGAGGEGNVVTPFHGLYVGPTGNDTTGDGTTAKPFATLAKVAAAAQAGDTIVFLNGTYTQVAGAVIPDGVSLMAETPGGVTLQGQNLTTLLSLAGSTRIEGLKFQTFGTVVKFVDDATATGTLTLVDSTFVNCQTACLSLTGSTKTIANVADDFVLGNGGNNFALLKNQATFNLAGGVLQAFTGGNVFNVNDDAVVALKNTSITGANTTAQAVLMDKKANVSLDHVTIATAGTSIITQKGQSTLVVKSSDFSTSAVPAYHCIRSEMDGVGSIDVSDTKLHSCGNGFSSTIPGSLTITRVQMYDMTTSGIDMGAGFLGVGGILRMTDSSIHDCVFVAMRFGSGSNLNDIKIRGTSIVGVAATTAASVFLDSSAASTVDLGTLAEPGGNTFQSTNVNQPALRNGGTGLYVSAVGNTWTANQQNADDQGHYSAPAGAGMKLEESNIQAGRNYVAPYQGAKILLAQNP